MIIHEIKRNPFEFLALFAVLAVGFIAYSYFDFHPHSQRRVVYVTGAAYFLWSILHHYRKGDLELSLVIEYLAMAVLASLLLTGTLL